MVFWVLVSLYIPLCLALLGVQWLLLPMASQYRPQLEAWLTEQTGQPVHIGSMNAQWQRSGPELTLADVRVDQADGTPGLTLKSLKANWSIGGLLTFRWHTRNLELNGLRLAAKRRTDGLFEVAGIALKPDGTEDNLMLDWLLRQRRVLADDVLLSWQDDTHSTPNMPQVRIQAELVNQFTHHQWGALVQSANLGAEPIDIRADFRSPLLSTARGRVRDWLGVAYLSSRLDRTEPVEKLLKSLDYRLDLQHAQARVWVDFKAGAVLSTLVDAQVGRVSFADPEVKAEPFALNHTSALLEVKGEAGLWRPSAVTVKRLTGQLQGQRQFGPSNLAFARSQDAGQLNQSLLLQNLDAEQARSVVMELAPHLRKPEWVDVLREYVVGGKIDHALLAWKTAPGNADATAVSEFNTDTHFQHLTVQHQGPVVAGQVQVTGFKNLSGSVRGNQAKGEWRVDGSGGELALPELFDTETFGFDTLKGQGAWVNLLSTDKPLELSFAQLQLANADLSADLKGRYVFNPQGADEADLKGRLLRADVSAVPKYLPTFIGADTRQWLKDSLLAGNASGGEFVLRGVLRQFPFVGHKSEGQFKVEVPISQASLRFAPKWPEITGIDGKVVFEGQAMRIVAQRAQTLGVPLVNVVATLPNLSVHTPVLSIVGAGEGEFKSMVDYVNNSPVNDLLSQALTRAEVTGNTRLNLDLRIPLDKPENTELKGSLLLKGNSLRLNKSMPMVTALDGAIRFTHQGLFIDQLQGQALAGPVQVKSSTDKTGKIDIRATGTAKANGLAQYLNPLLEPYLSGGAPYSVQVAVRTGRTDVDITSPLTGLEIKLPSPLSKKPEARLPLRVSQSLTGPTERWSVDLGADPQTPGGSYVTQLRALSTERQGAWSLDSLQWVMGMPLPVPAAGIQGDLRLPTLDADAWKAVVDQVSGRPASPKGPATVPSGLLGDLFASTNPDATAGRTRVRLRADKIQMGNKTFEGVTLAARTVEKRWQFDLNAKGVEGYFQWVVDKQRPEGAVLARFKTLTIPKTLDGGAKKLVEQPASSIPALDIQVDDFVLNDLRLGALTLRAVNQSREEVQAQPNKAREWRLEEMKLENPESTTQAKGVWRYTPGLVNQHTDIELTQTVRDAGGLLNRLGMEDVFKGGEGTLTGRLRWDDAPMDLDTATLGGQFKLISKKGQFLKADPGVAKLLGVLSLQGITRRFTLDFKDVFSQGFAYDSIEADVSLTEGVASTRNLKMIGPGATVVMDGTLDLDSETQNLNVVVLPDLNATGGSLVYSLLAANPAVGIASLIADFLLKDPISKVFSVQYKVTGPWAAPVIEKVKKSGDAQSSPPASGSPNP